MRICFGRHDRIARSAGPLPTPTTLPPAVKGRACVGCHGENGISQMETIHHCGQPDRSSSGSCYFRAGVRKNEQCSRQLMQINNDGNPQSRRLLRFGWRREGRTGRTIPIYQKGAQAAVRTALRRRLATIMQAPKQLPASPAQREDYLLEHRCAGTTRSASRLGRCKAQCPKCLPVKRGRIVALAQYLAHL